MIAYNDNGEEIDVCGNCGEKTKELTRKTDNGSVVLELCFNRGCPIGQIHRSMYGSSLNGRAKATAA